MASSTAESTPCWSRARACSFAAYQILIALQFCPSSPHFTVHSTLTLAWPFSRGKVCLAYRSMTSRCPFHVRSFVASLQRFQRLAVRYTSVLLQGSPSPVSSAFLVLVHSKCLTCLVLVHSKCGFLGTLSRRRISSGGLRTGHVTVYTCHMTVIYHDKQ